MRCHQEVIYAVFPYLHCKAHFTREEQSHLLLDTIVPFQTSLDPSFGEWVLNALVKYAYTREHPNLTLDLSPKAQEAYQVYLSYIDVLNPGAASGIYTPDIYTPEAVEV